MLELNEERIKELQCKNREMIKSKCYLEESLENMKQGFDNKEKENEEMKNELKKLKDVVNKLQMILGLGTEFDGQKSDDGLKIRPKNLHDVDTAVCKVVDERNTLLEEMKELRQRLKFDENMKKVSTERMEEKNSMFQKKVIELEKNIENLKNGIDVREEERSDLQEKFDQMKVVVKEEKCKILLKEGLEEITAEKDDMGNQPLEMKITCHGLNATLDEEFTFQKKITERITAEKDKMAKQLEDLLQKCNGLNIKMDEEITLRKKVTEMLEVTTNEKDEMEKQLEAMVQACHGLKAELSEETIVREKTEERLEIVTAERNEMITNLTEEMRIKSQVMQSLDERTNEMNELVAKKVELYKNYINEKNKRFEIEDELVKANDLIEELRVPKLNCLQVLIPCCFRRRR